MLMGRLTRDPELRFTPNGAAVCNIGLATNRYGKDQASGESKEFTDFHDVVVWNQGSRKLAELCGQYLQKGRMVYIEGRLQTRSWDDASSGQKRYKTEVNAADIQFIDSRNGASAEVGAGAPASSSVPDHAGTASDPDPEDVPF